MQSYFPDRPAAIPDLTNERDHRKALARGVNLALKGQTSNTMLVTLDPGTATTTIVDPRISLSTALHLAPQTAAAAAALPGVFVVCSKGQAIINHPNASGADQIFTVSIQG